MSVTPVHRHHTDLLRISGYPSSLLPFPSSLEPFLTTFQPTPPSSDLEPILRFPKDLSLNIRQMEYKGTRRLEISLVLLDWCLFAIEPLKQSYIVLRLTIDLLSSPSIATKEPPSQVTIPSLESRTISFEPRRLSKYFPSYTRSYLELCVGPLTGGDV
jgi:hypothetical protein